ncbi:glycosyltransferase family 2 protein [Planctomicrobium sp. SH668]|uniref:glycosyltransferase family 2 protein n=1 Tax=Planctomicrobium sp. SH668 TaxID=3448126 RepID=UPI003F5B4B6B
MSSQQRVSVVIPAYNAEKTILTTIESVLAQTVPVHEIIVVDDGSKDQTLAVIRNSIPSVRCVQQVNAGPAAARNHGVRLASGDWIAFLDADDSWLPEKIERQLRSVADEVGLIHTHTVGDGGKNSKDLDFDELWKHNYIGTSTVLVRKSVFDAVGGFHEDRKLIGAEDYHLWLRIARTGQKIVTVREELTRYTPAEGNLSGQIQRVIRGELLNLELLSKSSGFDPKQIQEKRISILEEYSKALFWMRDLPAARTTFRELLSYRFSPRDFAFYLATFVPIKLLDLKRQSGPTKNELLGRAAAGGVNR